MDQRTTVARDLIAWRRDIISDLGGDGNISTAQRSLIEIAVRLKLFVDHIDCYLMEQKRLVTRHGLVPALRERQRLSDSLTKTLTTIGLERRKAKGKVMSLETIRNEGESQQE